MQLAPAPDPLSFNVSMVGPVLIAFGTVALTLLIAVPAGYGFSKFKFPGQLALFVVVAYQGYRIAITAPDTFSGLVACGITTWLVVQAFINLAVVTAPLSS